MQYLVIFLLMGVGYAYFFYRRSLVMKTGGVEAHARRQLDELFHLAGDEHVTAAWEATTVPKKGVGEKAAEVVGAVTAGLFGVGVQVVGRPLTLACTSQNRVLVIDKENGEVTGFRPDNRPRFSDTGRKGTKRTMPTQYGWEEGTIVSLEANGSALEIDLAKSAASILTGWSGGGDVRSLTGPLPVQRPL
jgi:hypothetical protein